MKIFKEFFMSKSFKSYNYRFTTKLHHRIELEGAYEVSLAEIMFPFTWFPKLAGKIFIGNPKQQIVIQLKDIVCHSMYELVTAINGQILKAFPNSNNYFTFDEENKVNVHLETNHFVQFDIDSKNLLGFNKIRIEGRVEFGNKVLPMLNRINTLFVYSDILEYQFLGDAFAPLLRNVAIKQMNYGEHASIIYDTAHYVPVCRNSFETIEIDIKTDTGAPVPFTKGTLYVKLHFRPKSIF